LKDASRELVFGMAKQGEGQAEFIQGSDMDEKVMKQLNRALKPALTDVSGDYCTYLTNRFLLIGEKV
jgi:hypothetical protein